MAAGRGLGYGCAMSQQQYAYRSREQVARFFEGLDLLEPGLVTTSQWRNPEPPKDLQGDFYAAVGRVS